MDGVNDITTDEARLRTMEDRIRGQAERLMALEQWAYTRENDWRTRSGLLALTPDEFFGKLKADIGI